MDNFDIFLSSNLKRVFRMRHHPADDKAHLLARAELVSRSRKFSIPILSKQTKNLYRVHIYNRPVLSEHLEGLFAISSLEMDIFGQRHLVA